MPEVRSIKAVMKGRQTSDGAGVRLTRVFGYNEVPLFDPFLLLDHFGSDNPDDYIAGFPWHPHRGIETITYILNGEVKHGDSLGNKGVIRSGDCQWMTAGSGIIHEEMPERNQEGKNEGFQLWANLPSSQKMMDPRYRDITSDMIPSLCLEDKVNIKIIAGRVEGTTGPVHDVVTDPLYLDVTVAPQSEFRHNINKGHTVFAYIFEGKGFFDQERNEPVSSNHLVLYEDGDEVAVRTSDEQVRFLLISGKPIGEPVAWYGPIVMNTKAELEQAFREYREGTFIKKGKDPQRN
jgi:redox-sensitive bicupin YhaK (pirin superfamily)